MNNSGSDHRFLNDALTLEEAERAERAEWLQWRRGGLGGSDIAGVLGLSPWSSPWSVWADKVINRTDDNEAADAYDAAAIQAWGGHAYLNQAVA